MRMRMMRMTFTGCWFWWCYLLVCFNCYYCYYCSHNYSGVLIVVDGFATTTTTTTPTTTTQIASSSPRRRSCSHPLLPHHSSTRIYAKRRNYNSDDVDDDNDDYGNRNNNSKKNRNNNNNQRNNRNRNYNAVAEEEEQEMYNGSTVAVAKADIVVDDDDVDDVDDGNDDDETSSVVVEKILLKMKIVAATTVSANTNTFLDDNNERQQQQQHQQDDDDDTTDNTATATAIVVPSLNQIHDSINNAISILSNGLIERKEDSKLVVLAFLANEHILLLGKPGTGKSVLGLRLSKLLASSTGSGSSSSLLLSGNNNNNNNNNNGSNNTQTQTPQIFFQRLLTKFTTPEELFGPLSLKALENDIYRRNTVGYLPTCQIAFLDEIFKANSSILNTLLTILNERKFDNGIPIPLEVLEDDDDSTDNTSVNVMAGGGGGGTIRENCPIRTVVGASNELGNDSDELIALYDRFLIRKEVLPVSDENIIQLLQLQQQQSQTQSHQSQSQQSQQESENENEIDDDNNNNSNNPDLVELDDVIKYLSSTVDDSNSIIIDYDACLILKNLRIYLRDNHDITISDRRLVKIVKLVKLSAACDLRDQVDPIIDFIGILQHCLWNIPSERIIIRDWLWDNITPLDYNNNGDGGNNITPNQLRFLLQNLRQEILDILKNKTNGCIETGGAVAQIVKQDDIKVLDSLRIELENIIIIAQTKMNSLVRHIALIHRLELKEADTNKGNTDNNNTNNFALWMDPDDVSTIQQLLLPRAELLLPEIKSIVEDAEVLQQTISISSIPIIPSNYLRINIIEMIWDLDDDDDEDNINSNSNNGYRDFTSDELQMTSKAAQSKYDLETFRRWKRAIKKQKQKKMKKK